MRPVLFTFRLKAILLPLMWPVTRPSASPAPSLPDSRDAIVTSRPRPFASLAGERTALAERHFEETAAQIEAVRTDRMGHALRNMPLRGKSRFAERVSGV